MPIEIQETANQYLVKIPPEFNQRARNITGRRWNPELEAWVYPRSLECYEAIQAEFQNDADFFNISPPSNPTNTNEEEIGDDSLSSEPNDHSEELPENNDSSPEGIQGQIDEMHEKINMILAHLSHTNEPSKHPRPTQEEQNSNLKADEPTNSADFKTHEKSDLDLNLLEKSLILIAFSASGNDPSFANWLNEVRPLCLPSDFISKTHEKIKESLADSINIPDYRNITFIDVIKACREKQIFDTTRHKDVFNTLHFLNKTRNIFSHPPKGFGESERVTRSIIYLLNLALIWQDVASEPVD